MEFSSFDFNIKGFSTFQVDIDLDVGGLGYTSIENSRIGFFAEKCGVTDSATQTSNFFLVGSQDGIALKEDDKKCKVQIVKFKCEKYIIWDFEMTPFISFFSKKVKP